MPGCDIKYFGRRETRPGDPCVDRLLGLWDLDDLVGRLECLDKINRHGIMVIYTGWFYSMFYLFININKYYVSSLFLINSRCSFITLNYSLLNWLERILLHGRVIVLSGVVFNIFEFLYLIITM